MSHTTTPTDNLADGTWPGHEHHVPVADTSMLPGSETAPPAAVDLLHRAALGAHETIDRLADSAAPALQQLSERVCSTEAALQAKADQLRTAGAEWTDKLRGTVRSNPLAAVAAAVVLGALVTHIARARR